MHSGLLQLLGLSLAASGLDTAGWLRNRPCANRCVVLSAEKARTLAQGLESKELSNDTITLPASGRQTQSRRSEFI